MPRNINQKVRVVAAACLATLILYAVTWLAPVTWPAASAQSGESIFVRKIGLKANDIVYSPATKMLYASVPSSVGAGGNTITPISPSTGDLGTPVFIGSEPSKLAISDDGQAMYAMLEGAYSIRRFNIQTQTPGLQFPVGSDNSFGVYSINDMAVAPGEPGTLAVVRYYRGLSPPEAGVAIFENGVQRSKTGVGHIAGSDYVAYSATASKLYGGGNYDGLRTMTIDSTGVASTTYATETVGARIKVAGGLVYGSAGEVMNPDTGTLLGTFSGASSYAFVPDAAAGRVYYLTGGDSYSSSASTLTLKAYDVNTFLPVGTQTITGTTGAPTTLVRWGANGLAFRTSTGEVYAIQTNLIPSSSPIPTPTPTPTATPTPTPTPAAAFVRQFPVTTNSLAYNAARQAIYVTLPSTAAANGNSIAQINTSTGAVESPVFVGSEPKRMAFSDDGQTMYVGLDGAAAVRRIDLQTSTPGLQFSVGFDSFNGTYLADYMAVMPGAPDTVAVGRTNSGSVAVFDNGVPRTKVGGFGFLQFGQTASRLYAGGGPVQKLNVDAAGLTSVGSIPAGRGGTTSFFDKTRGLLFTSGGDVYDPEAGTILGEFTGLGYSNLMAVDSAAGRVYFLTGDSFSGSGTWKLIAYDMNTFLPIGYANLTGISGDPSDLVRWGTNGLAFRTGPSFSSTTPGRVVLVETALIDGSQAVPTPTPTPTATPTPTPVYVPTFVRKVALPAGDVTYNEATQSLYASVASRAGAGGNSITPINPSTGALGTPVFVGSEPGRLALGDDGKTLYVYLEGSKNMRRFDLSSMTPGLQFSVGSQPPSDFEVMPGSPQTLAVSSGTNFTISGPTIYDDGVARSKSGTGGFYTSLPIEFGASPSVIYGSGGSDLVKFTVDATGIASSSVTSGLLGGGDIKFAGGLLYNYAGRVVDPEAKKLLGTFYQSGGTFAVDTTLGRIFFITGDSYSNSGKVLKAYDLNTFLPLGSVNLPNVTGFPTRMVRWGANGLAVRTSNTNSTGSGQTDNGGVFVIQSALVNPSQPVPTGVALSAEQLTTYEFNSPLTVTVTRSGDVSAATSVNYATSDGTATAGADYIAASGTVTFAAGELTKTFNITIKPDNIYEGTETFNVTLSNPTGGAVLAGPASAQVSLFDDDSKPSITINDVKVNEGNAGTTEAQFLVTLSNASVETVSVNYATGDGTASSASDYVAASGSVTFAPLTTSALIKVNVNGDMTVEPDETFKVNLSGPVNSYLNRSQATGTIANDDGPGRFEFGNQTYAVSEDGGSATITVNRVNGLSGAATVDYASGGGTATAGTDYTPVSGTLTFAEGEPSKSFVVPIINDSNDEPNETVTLTLSNPTGGPTLSLPSVATLTITNDDRPTFQLSSANYEVGEADGQLVITVTRTGDTSAAASVGYSTSDGNASENSDYTLTLGRLRFAPGETSKTVNVLVTNDVLVEPDETFLFFLGGASGASLGTPSAATVTLHSDDAAPKPNPVGDGFDAAFFVRQHYHDFLNREPDADGLQFWTNEITQCGADLQCRDVKRVNVSAAFFLSIEFQQTGYYVYRLNQVAYNTQEALNWRSFLADSQDVGRDVEVGVGDWQGRLEANKKSYADRFVTSSAFSSTYQVMSNAQYVDALNAHTLDPLAPGLGGALTQDERDQLVADLNQSKKTRAEVLRAVAENPEFSRRQSNKAFVLMEYFGYLRRNPNSGPDADFSGYNFWLGKLNEFKGNYVAAEMVKAFLDSTEYQHRFGQ